MKLIRRFKKLILASIFAVALTIGTASEARADWGCVWWYCVYYQGLEDICHGSVDYFILWMLGIDSNILDMYCS